MNKYGKTLAHLTTCSALTLEEVIGTCARDGAVAVMVPYAINERFRVGEWPDAIVPGMEINCLCEAVHRGFPNLNPRLVELFNLHAAGLMSNQLTIQRIGKDDTLDFRVVRKL